MGPISRGRLILLTALFLVAALVVHRPAASIVQEKPLPLATSLARIDGWRLERQIPLDSHTLEELQLDDYAFLTYRRGSETISLYVGYYFSSAKVGAPHHPLVCFSGQGWEVSPVRRQEFRLAGEETLLLSVMTAGREAETQYIAYWFQAHDEPATGPFTQKLRLSRKRLLQEGEESAFVRISMPVGENTEEQCRQVVQEFVQKFYPVFLNYIKSQAA